MSIVKKIRKELLDETPKISKGINFPFNFSVDPAYKTGNLFDSPLTEYVRENMRSNVPSFTADAQYILLAELSAKNANGRMMAEQAIAYIGKQTNMLDDELAVSYRIQRSLFMRLIFTPKQICLRNFAGECVDLESLTKEFSKTPYSDIRHFSMEMKENLFCAYPESFVFQEGWMP